MAIVTCSEGHTHHHTQQDSSQSCGAACAHMLMSAVAGSSRTVPPFITLRKVDAPLIMLDLQLAGAPFQRGLSAEGMKLLLQKYKFDADIFQSQGYAMELRTPRAGYHDFPLALLCQFKSGGAHWVVIGDKQRRFARSAAFCVLDPHYTPPARFAPLPMSKAGTATVVIASTGLFGVGREELIPSNVIVRVRK